MSAEFNPLNIPVRTDVETAIGEALNAELAVLFVHIDWAPMKQQRELYFRFAAALAEKHPACDVSFQYLDCTAICEHYRPLCELPGWQSLEEKDGTSLLHAYGEFVWIYHGIVKHVERPLNYDSQDALVAKTESLFSLRADT